MACVNVLLLVTELNVGGAERVVAQLASGLSRDRYRVSVACLYDPGPVADEIRSAGIPVFDLAMRGKWDVTVTGRFHRLLRHQRVDVLHSHLIHANLIAPFSGRLAGVPVVITTRHNVHIGPVWREWLNWCAKNGRDVAIAISEEVRATEVERSGAPPSSVVVIPNGISVDRFAAPDQAAVTKLRRTWGVGADGFVIGTLARFHEQKGHRYLLDAQRIMLDRAPHTKLLLVGEGVLFESVRERASHLGIADSVILPGVRHEVPEILALLDLFVLPSLWEGLPISILEAMAAGKPVVATRVGGVPEVVVDGETGLLVPPRDPEALAGAIARLLRDPQLRHRMGQAGQERVREHFSVEQMVRRTETLYEELLEEKGY